MGWHVTSIELIGEEVIAVHLIDSETGEGRIITDKADMDVWIIDLQNDNGSSESALLS